MPLDGQGKLAPLPYVCHGGGRRIERVEMGQDTDEGKGQRDGHRNGWKAAHQDMHCQHVHVCQCITSVEPSWVRDQLRTCKTIKLENM